MDKKKPLLALKPGASGDISLADDKTSNDFIVWCQKDAAPYNPTSLIYRGLLYVLLDRGFMACYDPLTGELVYDKERLPEGKAFTASPWGNNDKVFCIKRRWQDVRHQGRTQVRDLAHPTTWPKTTWLWPRRQSWGTSC